MKIRNLLEKMGIRRVEGVVLAMMVALPLGALVLAETPAWADAGESEEEEEGEGGGWRGAARVNPEDAASVAALKNECASCHVVYPARLLPAASWQKIMGKLGDHYGTDATIDDPKVVKQITAFLLQGSGDASRIRDVKGAAVPMRITETRWFVREHDEVKADAWKRASIKSAANCGACHPRAAEGGYGEREIRIPKQ